MAFALKFGVPVIGLNTWQLARNGRIEPIIPEASDAEEAVRCALDWAKSGRHLPQ
jgi:hypothetical protein